MKLSRSFWLAAAALALLSAPLRAQGLYGLAPEGDPHNRPDSYRLRVRQEVLGLLGSWKRAWDTDNAGDAADLYTRDGVLVGPHGEQVQTRDSLRAELGQLMRGAGALRYSVLDFDTSGEMAYVRGEMVFATDASAPAAQPQTGSFVLVAKRQREDVWRIRSLTLIPLASSAPSAAPAPAAAPPSGT
ncbi:MAG TPA: nuclear transport factor 2 family protein [Longimicrobiaceae bacterium]|nr:nuclear transport factor 2 family protein [Longimicrobiaceae bacterium]